MSKNPHKKPVVFAAGTLGLTISLVLSVGSINIGPRIQTVCVAPGSHITVAVMAAEVDEHP